MYLDVTSHRDEQHMIYLHYLLKIVIFINQLFALQRYKYIFTYILGCGYSLSISGRGNECSPGNSDLDVCFIYFTHSVAVSWDFLSDNQKD